MNEAIASPGKYGETPVHYVPWDRHVTPLSRAVGLRERDHHSFVRKTSQRYGRTHRGPEHNFIAWLRRAEKLVSLIASSDNPPFVEVHYPVVGKHGFRLAKIGTEFCGLCKTHDPAVASHYQYHRFNPPLTVILNVLDSWAAKLKARASLWGEPLANDELTREILMTATAEIRNACRSDGYKKEVDNYKRNEEKNIASCCEYMAAQFQRRSQLLILRIDLYFRPLSKDSGYTREADEQHVRFLRALREGRVIDDVLGYISKREDGVDRGIHFHLLVVADGHKHRDAANLTRKMGEEWVRRCGHGEYAGEIGQRPKGSYFNCYTRKNDYLFNCLGLIRPGDVEKMRGLRLAIEYLCKETSQLKPNPPRSLAGEEDPPSTTRKGTRNLRKGIMPKGPSGRGAPRSSNLDTSAIERELLKR